MSALTADQPTEHPLVGTAAGFARAVLAPTSLETDRIGVSAERIDQLRQLGLLAHSWGGDARRRRPTPAEDRAIHESIAYGCLNTWLVWAQHFGVTSRLVRSLEQGRVPGELERAVLDGAILAGAALSDVRGFPRRYIAATPVRGGWEFDGTISWVSGWGLNGALAVAGVDSAGQRVVMALVPVDRRLAVSHLDLRAAVGSRTERVELERVFVPEHAVVEVVGLEQWRRADSAFASNAGPHLFGLSRRILDELGADAEPAARGLAARWRPRVDRLSAEAYELTDSGEATIEETLPRRVALKAEAGEALTLLARALVIARSGRALTGDNAAQMHARNALFVLVQGQTAAVKAAQLARLEQR